MKPSLTVALEPTRSPEDLMRRVVLLGASNLTMGIGTVLHTAYGAWGQPLEVFAAYGHGRSYGQANRLLGRELPGILECGLWPLLEQLPPAPTAALVTDIGNDLLYEQPVERVAGWVEDCLDRLAAAGARTVVTQLPVDNLRTLSSARFRVMRGLFFPHSRMSLAEVSRRVNLLNERVSRLAEARGAELVTQRTDWYGFDPIHIKLRRRASAWQEILGRWSDSSAAPLQARGSLARTLYLCTRAPQQRKIVGIERRASQPSARLRDGTTVAIF